jgi:peroxiredoxin/glutaredoxin
MADRDPAAPSGDAATARRLEGTRVPAATLRHSAPPRETVTTTDLLRGRTVALFGLPGAFTPTCTNAHVPRYEELAHALAREGVDEIVCVAVNDAFVLEAWRRSLACERVRFVADGNGELHRALRLLRDAQAEGLGQRARRYSMLVRDGMIEKAWVEPDEPGDPFVVADADTMLAYLAPGAPPPLDVVVFSRPECAWSARAKRRLDAAGIEYATIDASPRALRAVSREASTPQVFVDGARIGGCQDLEAWLDARSGTGERRDRG